MPKLTKTVIDAAAIREAPYFVWCSDLPGFGVRVFPSGKKTFYADYYNAAGQRKRMALGPLGKLTAEEARKMARITLGTVLTGDDPALERKTRRKSLTVTQLCDQYVEAAKKGLVIGRGGRPKKQSTLDTDLGRIERHIKPLLGRKLVIDLAQSDVAKFIRDVTAGKTAVVEKTKKLRGKAMVDGGAGTAGRTAGLLGGILSYAMSEGVIDRNPAHGVKKPATRRKDRRLSADEYRALGDVLKAAEHEPWQAIAIIQMLCLSGCRRGEIVNLQWSEVEGDTLRLGDSKTGASVRPLGKAALEVLDGIERAGRYVFPAVRSDDDKPFGGAVGAIERLFKKAGISDCAAHTLRHSFASVAADLDYSDSTIGAMLGHAGTTITSRYTHRLDTVLVAAANKVAAEIDRQMTGRTADVVELRRA